MDKNDEVYYPELLDTEIELINEGFDDGVIIADIESVLGDSCSICDMWDDGSQVCVNAATSADVVTVTCASRAFAMFPRVLVSVNYPKNKLVGHELLIYLQSLVSKDDDGLSSSGQDNYIKSFRPIDRSEYKRIKQYLEDKGLIKHVASCCVGPMKGKLKYYVINIPPVYDKVINDFIGVSEKVFNSSDAEHMKEPFIILPSNLFLKDYFKRLKLTDIEVNVLLKIYRYYFPKTFGGVDFNVVHREHGTQVVYVHDRILDDLHTDKLDFLNALKKLEDKGLLCWRDIVVSIEQVEHEEVIRFVRSGEYYEDLRVNLSEVTSLMNNGCYEFPVHRHKVLTVIRLSHEFIEDKQAKQGKSANRKRKTKKIQGQQEVTGSGEV